MKFHIEISRKDPDVCELVMKSFSKNGFQTIEAVIDTIRLAFPYQYHITKYNEILHFMERYNCCIIFIINRNDAPSILKDSYQIELMTTDKMEEIIREKQKVKEQLTFPAIGELPKYASDIIQTKQYHKN